MLHFLRDLVGSPLIQRMIGADIQSALDDQTYMVYVKGSKMAQVAESGSTIYDLDAGTVTTIDSENRTYSVETFADLRGQIDRAEQWMKRSQNGAILFDVQIDATSQKRVIGGYPANKTLITLTAQSESAWGRPVIHVNSWLAPLNKDFKPLYDFSARAAAKLSSIVSAVPSFFGAAVGSATPHGTNKAGGISMLDEISVTGVTNPISSLFSSNATRDNKPVISLEVQSSNFSFQPLPSSKFAIPAGFAQQRSHS